MIAAISVLALTVATLPSMQPGFVVAEADYPPFALRYEHEGVVGFTVGVDAAGVPHDCFVRSSSTFAELDARTCEIVTARMRFVPAHDKRGRAVPGVYSNRVRWKIAPNEPEPFVDRTTTTNLTFAPDGSVASCKIELNGLQASADGIRCAGFAGLPALLGTPLADLAAAQIIFSLRTGVDVTPPPEALPGGVRQIAVSVRIVVAPDGSIVTCTPIVAIVQRALPNPCASFPTGKPRYTAASAGVERRGVSGVYVSIQRRVDRP